MTTIAKILGKENYNIDMPHRIKYANVINLLGYENVCKCIPFTEKELREIYAKDPEHLNSTKADLNRWDIAGGFICNDPDVYPTRSMLRTLLKGKGVTCYSCAEGVCILKECAKQMMENK